MDIEERLYVLGHPIFHSKSPAMYNAVFQEMGLRWYYDFMDCSTAEKAQAFVDTRAFLSINITMPYKPLALAAADVTDPAAVAAQGANVLVNENHLSTQGCEKSLLKAYNTDGAGCVAFLMREGICFSDSAAVVCGTGPTSLSLMHAFVSAGCTELWLVGRDAARAKETLSGYQERTQKITPDVVFHAGCYQDAAVRQAISRANLIADATPLGMHQGDPPSFETALLGTAHAPQNQTVFDVVYGHGETALIKAARHAGCRVLDGAGMLVGQAVATLHVVFPLAGVTCPLTEEELFSLMADAAGFAI